jgi:REP element-mobilizing transposase RayT
MMIKKARRWFALFATLLLVCSIVVFLGFLYSVFINNLTNTFETKDINEISFPSPHPRGFFGLVYQTTSDNFIIYTDESVEEYVGHIVNVLEDAYVQLSEKLDVKLDKKVAVRVYRDYEAYCKATGLPLPSFDIDPHATAGAFNETGITAGIHITPPSDTILARPDKHYDKVLAHELVHALQVLITPHAERDNITQWLFEGLAHYLSDTISRHDYQEIIESGVMNNTILSLIDIDKDYQLFSDVPEYNAYSTTIIEFVDKTYGFEKVMDFLKNPNEYNAVFGFEREEFERQWKQFLFENYAP